MRVKTAVSYRAALDVSATHPLVPTVPEIGHSDVKAYVEGKGSSKNGGDEDA